jgi:hypothetical protein
MDISVIRLESQRHDGIRLAIRKCRCLGLNVELHILWEDVNIRVYLVGGISLWMENDRVPEQHDSLVETVRILRGFLWHDGSHVTWIRHKIFPQVG